MTSPIYKPAIYYLKEQEKLEDIKVNSCNTCRYIRGRRDDTYKYEEWQCFKFLIGIEVVLDKHIYLHCNEARNNPDKCGLEGKLYEEYVPPVRIPEPTIGGKVVIPTEIVFDDATISANREAAAKRLKELKEKKSGNLASIKAEEL